MRRPPEGWDLLRPILDPETGQCFILCPRCRSKRYIKEGPMTECSTCGKWFTFAVATYA